MQQNYSCLKYLLKKADLPCIPNNKSYQQTCVFLLLFEKEYPHVLAIQKAYNKEYPWSNQVAFPGGHVEKGDLNNESAAFRELEEEMNISSENVECIGSMGHFQTIGEKNIEVFLGIWNGKYEDIIFDTSEISQVLEIPLTALYNNHVEKKFHGYIPCVDDLVYPHDNLIIWGVTARMLHFFIELIFPCLEKNEYKILKF